MKGKQSSFQILLDLAIYYFEKDENPQKTSKDKQVSKYEDFTKGNLEDALTKVIKLLANLATEEE